MADPMTALMVVAGGAKVGGFLAGNEARLEKERAIDLQAEERMLQYQQKTLANYAVTNKILDAQLASASARGVGLGSPSLEAIERNTANVSARRQKNLDIEEDIFERNAEIEKKNVNDTFFAQVLGETASFASQAYGLKK